jgi:hypothetical protein
MSMFANRTEYEAARLAQAQEPIKPVSGAVDELLAMRVGDSSFEDFYEQYHPHTLTVGIKQVARDAYAAGMEDPLICELLSRAQQAPAVSEYHLNGLESCANWLFGRSETVWAKEFQNGWLMKEYAKDLRALHALLSQPAAAPAARPAYRSDEEIVKRTEEAAHFLASWRWGLEPERSDQTMRSSGNPKAQECWAAACRLQEIITDSDAENAAQVVDDVPAAAPVSEQTTDREPK